ncbi:MAG: ABC transporter permease [Hyphomicrobiaceae bacterium]
MSAILEQILHVGFFAAAVRLAVPLILGALGEVFAERAGVMNLGIEGTMLLASMVGFTVAYFSGSLWLAVIAAVIAGLLLGLLMALFCVGLGLDQTVAGIGLTMTASGLAYFSYRLIFGEGSIPPAVQPFQTVPIPGLSSIPFLGPVLFDQFALTYLTFLAVPAAAWYLFRTPAGLALRTTGENPYAAAAAGISVGWTRTRALMIGGAMSGLAGAYLNLAAFSSFSFGIVSGRGWICLALVALGRWNPWLVAAAALLFGAVDALQLRLQTSGVIDVPYQLMLMLPYVATLVAMIVSSRHAHAPAALMRPYRSEER